jgi:hypothetical protein
MFELPAHIRKISPRHQLAGELCSIVGRKTWLLSGSSIGLDFYNCYLSKRYTGGPSGRCRSGDRRTNAMRRGRIMSAPTWR